MQTQRWKKQHMVILSGYLKGERKEKKNYLPKYAQFLKNSLTKKVASNVQFTLR